MLPNVDEIATVVVCEDDDPTRELLCDHLSADRYRALPAPSASDALRLCGYNQPDLMLLDLGLPDAPRDRRAPGDPGGRRALRSGAAGPCPLGADQRGRPAAGIRGRGGRLPREALPLSGAARAGGGGAAAPVRCAPGTDPAR